MLPIKTLILFLLLSPCLLAQTQKVWLDVDTGNEMDDLYVIARVLKDDQIELIRLSSAYFNNPDLLLFYKWNAYGTEGLVTIEDSQRLNEELLEIMDMTGLPHPMGANRQIGRT